MKDSINGKEPIIAPKIRRPDSSAKKHGRSDINQFKPYGDQATHFTSYTKSPNAVNSCNEKNR